MSEVIPNPYGANGTTSDPREQTCWDNYVKGIAEGRVNAYQSAIDAGYSESNALNITTREWFIERLGKLKRKDMVSKAERNLDKIMDLPLEEKANLVLDASKFIAKTLGKDDYSERTDITSGGKEIKGNNIIFTNFKDESISE